MCISRIVWAQDYACINSVSLTVENDMDGEALTTLIGLTPGPDCLKNLVKKVGWRLKVYKAIKELYEGENVSLNNRVRVYSIICY